MRAALVWMTALAVVCAVACVRDSTIVCGELRCPGGHVCTATGCASADAVAACDGKPDGMTCTSPSTPAGVCSSGVCTVAVCGNAISEPGESCDDGNREPGDGCSARCDSDETCGNGVVDALVGEQCDDEPPGLSQDGCTSLCTAELATWRNVSPSPLRVRENAAYATDTDRQRTVVFGGTVAAALDSTTWEWDGVAWAERKPVVSPSARFGAGMAYDRARRRIILFGGTTGTGTSFNDTWEWDGVEWRQLTPSRSPPARHAAGFAYDEVRQRIVLFAGSTGQTGVEPLDDLWEWDGTTWTERASANGPSGRWGAAMSYAGSGRVLLQGGTVAAGFADDDTWLWDGTMWIEAMGSGGPGSRMFAQLAYDAARGRAVLHGASPDAAQAGRTWEWTGSGWVSSTFSDPPLRRSAVLAQNPTGGIVLHAGTGYSDTWVYSGTAWTQRATAPSPQPRQFSVMAYDPDRGEVVLFGGRANNTPLTSTWIWDGSRWSERATGGPAAGFTFADYAMAYDAARRAMIMFGGVDTASGAGATWRWDHDRWTQLRPVSAPIARAGHSMSYDSKREKIVLLSGANGITPIRDTWEWNGTDWTRVDTATSPPRFLAAMVYDRARARTLMFGGSSDSAEARNETWTWDGTAWTQLPTTMAPSARTRHMMFYDERRREVVLFGGFGGEATLEDTWIWNGVDWQVGATVASPMARRSAAATYDSIRGKATMFGGATSFGVELADTWSYSHESGVSPADRCSVADTDLDGLAGCADPDCWGRCDPTCPPGDVCAGDRRRCGDGTCAAVENHLICSADCPLP